MRILILSNFYPPARPGGYTQWCYEVAEGLKARGHEVVVLTSHHEKNKAPEGERDVHRLLHLENRLDYYDPMDFLFRWRKKQRENAEVMRRLVASLSPEVIFVWGMWALSQSLPTLAEELMPRRVVYYLSDYWPSAQDMHLAYWELPARHWYLQSAKSLLAKMGRKSLGRESLPSLKFEHVMTVSEAVRDKLVKEGVPVGHAKVVYGGTDANRFPQKEREPTAWDEKGSNLLYMGQLVEHKGVHTALEAMALLCSGSDFGLHLTLVGNGHPAYEATLRTIVRRENLSERVTFKGSVRREEIAEAFVGQDILLFPSIYEEPLARVTQEAMLAGLVVVGTTTGGTKEILEEGVNGLTFPAGDAAALASQIERLVSHPEMIATLSRAARQTVLERFSQERMVDEIEAFLKEVVAL